MQGTNHNRFTDTISFFGQGVVLFVLSALCDLRFHGPAPCGHADPFVRTRDVDEYLEQTRPTLSDGERARVDSLTNPNAYIVIFTCNSPCSSVPHDC